MHGEEIMEEQKEELKDRRAGWMKRETKDWLKRWKTGGLRNDWKVGGRRLFCGNDLEERTMEGLKCPPA